MWLWVLVWVWVWVWVWLDGGRTGVDWCKELEFYCAPSGIDRMEDSRNCNATTVLQGAIIGIWV